MLQASVPATVELRANMARMLKRPQRLITGDVSRGLARLEGQATAADFITKTKVWVSLAWSGFQDPRLVKGHKFLEAQSR
jgi:hypothetical protein